MFEGGVGQEGRGGEDCRFISDADGGCVDGMVAVVVMAVVVLLWLQ